MYEKCYFCLDQLPKLKKESTASFFVNFGRSRGTKEPTYITVPGKSEQRSNRSVHQTALLCVQNKICFEENMAEEFFCLIPLL